ncbi:MAG: hypothetical protein AB1540_12265 [Bdellovibrionota bacterium]
MMKMNKHHLIKPILAMAAVWSVAMLSAASVGFADSVCLREIRATFEPPTRSRSLFEWGISSLRARLKARPDRTQIELYHQYYEEFLARVGARMQTQRLDWDAASAQEAAAMTTEVLGLSDELQNLSGLEGVLKLAKRSNRLAKVEIEQHLLAKLVVMRAIQSESFRVNAIRFIEDGGNFTFSLWAALWQKMPGQKPGVFVGHSILRAYRDTVAVSRGKLASADDVGRLLKAISAMVFRANHREKWVSSDFYDLAGRSPELSGAESKTLVEFYESLRFRLVHRASFAGKARYKKEYAQYLEDVARETGEEIDTALMTEIYNWGLIETIKRHVALAAKMRLPADRIRALGRLRRGVMRVIEPFYIATAAFASVALSMEATVLYLVGSWYYDSIKTLESAKASMLEGASQMGLCEELKPEVRAYYENDLRGCLQDRDALTVKLERTPEGPEKQRVQADLAKAILCISEDRARLKGCSLTPNSAEVLKD